MRKGRVIRVIVLVAVLVMVINSLYKVLSWKDTTGGYLSAYTQLYNIPENTVDVVFVGTSHVYCGIYPSILWRDYGIASFDMAVSGQDKQSAYYSLREVLKTQKPKVVLVDLFALYYEIQENEANEYRNLLGMKYSTNMFDLIRNYNANPGIEKRNYYLRFPIIHTRYRELSKYDFEPYLPSVYGKGEDIYFENRGWYEGAENNYSKTEKRTSLSKVELEWLESLKGLSEEYGFKLCFTLLPAEISDDLQEKINTAADWALLNDVDYYDLNKTRETLDITEKNDYLDINHLNAYGAEKVTRFLYNNVLSNCGLEDHRGNQVYETWNLNACRLLHEQNLFNLQTAQQAEEFTAILRQSEDMVAVISIEGIPDGRDYTGAMNNLGISEAEWRDGGFWIYQNGNASKLSETTLRQGVEITLGRDDYLRIKKGRDLSGWNVQLNGEGLSSMQYGLNIVVYDNFLEKNIQRREF